MDNDTKSLLMQYLGRFAEHFEIPEYTLYSFKKRNELMEKVKEKNPEAFVIIDELFTSFIKSDRIHNDKEKYDKARVLWEAEVAASDKDKVTAEMHLIQFCKTNSIPIGALSLKEI